MRAKHSSTGSPTPAARQAPLVKHLGCILVVLLLWCATPIRAACPTDIGSSMLHVNITDASFNLLGSVPLSSVAVTFTNNLSLPLTASVDGETVTVSAVDAPAGFSLAGTLSKISAGSAAVFSNLVANSPPAGPVLLKFSSCGMDTELEVSFSTAATAIEWVSYPSEVTSYGLFVEPFVIRVIDGVRGTTTPHYTGEWELAVISPAGLSVANNKTSPQNNLMTWSQLSPAVSTAMAGSTIQVQLVAPPGALTVPAAVTITVVNCSHGMKVHPVTTTNDDAIGDGSFVKEASAFGPIRLRFPLVATPRADALRCRYDGAEYTMTIVDLCHADCPLPATVTPSTAKDLEVSTTAGSVYRKVGTLAATDTSTRKLVIDPSFLGFEGSEPGRLVAYTDQYNNVNLSLTVSDSLGSRLYDAPPVDVECTTVSPNAASTRLSVPYEFQGSMIYPNITATTTSGRTYISLDFESNLTAGLHPFCCNVTGANPTGVEGACMTADIRSDCDVPPQIDSITSAGCSAPLPNGSLTNCNPNGLHEFVLTGTNFGNTGAVVYVTDPNDNSTYACNTVVHDSQIPSQRIVASGCQYPKQVGHLVVAKPASTFTVTHQELIFVPAPVIKRIIGCTDSFEPSTSNCFTNGTSVVTIIGQNFGGSGASVRFYPHGSNSYISATAVSQNDTHLEATGFAGSGSRLEVAVSAANGAFRRESHVTMTYTASVTIPCPFANGSMCNSRGTCDATTGVCACNNDASGGYWSGGDCSVCQGSWFGPECKNACPSAFGTTCASNGTCADGLAGSGLCTCAPGYGGLACEHSCPGPIGSPCSNRGTCNQNQAVPTCTCTADPVLGFWGGADCSVCNGLYTGSTCTQRCPTSPNNPSVPCDGTGTCTSTFSSAVCVCPAATCGGACELSGAACGTCPVGQYGPACANFCPGYANAGGTVTTCSGHGSCLSGVSASGSCICNSGFGGSSCNLACPVTGGGLCSGHGTCDQTTGTCSCDLSFFGVDCGSSCPGYPGSVCSGRGQCFDGRTGNGTCGCHSGWAGTNCNLECPGGSASPCTFNGLCSGTTVAQCNCFNDTSAGHWSGSSCSVCATNWYGSDCKGQCVKTNGLQCAGHGACDSLLNCTCQASNVNGFWEEPTCADCKPFYFGSECRNQCPGGACSPCSGHGTCADGRLGSGVCTCQSNSSGYWDGAKCNDCAANYYGDQCTTACPGTSGGTPCSGHGTCDDGLTGAGTCTCTADATNGFFGGLDCSTCRDGYYGAGCLLSCPGTTPDVTCSGHGSCSAGTCICDAFFGESDCSVGCFVDPATPGVPCNGHGACTALGVCQCNASVGTGFWSTETCGDCLDGYYGSSCIAACPQSGGQICGGNGVCSGGTGGSGGCVCDDGFAGTACNLECPGGAALPCSGHGTCDSLTASCTCFADSVNGYWAGSNCSQCDALYMSTECTVKCPVGTNPTVPCSGHGVCLQGKCLSCSSGYCGVTCELSGFACSTECPDGYFGATCLDACPGVLASGSACHGHGGCSEGKAGTGLCICFNGYHGSDCSSECLPSAGTPCSGHGTCSPTDGVCTCDTGYKTATCAVLCPGGASNICSGNGQCLDATGLCDCNAGFGLANCSALCPGAYVDNNGAVAGICSGHGTCVQASITCQCNNDATSGFWTGALCDACQSGYFGDSCTGTCVNGVTNGTQCTCNPNWSGPACDQPCPTNATGAICSGHGTCLWGNQYNTSTCQCDTNYYNEICAVYCTKDICRGNPYNYQNPECHPDTGVCRCASNPTDGYWGTEATNCIDCQLFYWGESCTQSCPCLSRGSCEKDTGACSCFDSNALGHFEGTSCERCKAGFIGTSCKGKDVTVARQRPCTSLASVRDTSQFILMDLSNDLIITGARPTVVCNLTTKEVISEFDMNATVIGGSFPTVNTMHLTLTRMEGEVNGDTTMNIEVTRGRTPDFTPLRAGNKFSMNLSAVSSSSTRRRLSAFHVYAVPTVVETVELSSTKRLIVYSNGVVQHINGLDMVGEFYFDSYFTMVQGAAATSSVLIDPARLILVGTLNGEYQIIAAELDLTATPAVTQVKSTLASTGVPFCASGNCISAAKVVTDGTYVIVALITRQGVGVLRFRYTQLAVGGRIETNSVIENLDILTVVNVTALTIDSFSGAGFVAINLLTPLAAEPSTIYKFDLLNLQVYGSVRFQRVVDTNEIVTGFTKNPLTRTLFASVPLREQLNIVPLNLYAVTKVFPPIADTVGGTVVTVEGEGFINDNTFVCDFNGTDIPAQFQSTRKALCTAPSGGDERCEGTPLELSVGKNQYTQNDVPLRRVPSARIESVQTLQYLADGVDNAYASLTGGQQVVLRGQGFQSSQHLACRFQSDKETHISRYADRDYIYFDGQQGTLFNNARFVNATAIECDIPAFQAPSSGRSTLEVTLDGVQFSSSGMRFDVIGTGVSLRVFANDPTTSQWTTTFSLAYSSGLRVDLDAFDVFVVDSEGQRLRRLDNTSRSVGITLAEFRPVQLVIGNSSLNLTTFCDNAPPSGQTIPIMFNDVSSRTQTTTNGRATFNGWYFQSPPAGTYIFSFMDATTGWSVNQSVVVNVGVAEFLRICREPSASFTNEAPLLVQQPLLYVEDLGGNLVTGTALNALNVEATYLVESTFTTKAANPGERARPPYNVPISTAVLVNETRTIAAQPEDNFFVFAGLQMNGLHGKSYRMNFTARFGDRVLSVLSQQIAVEPCRNMTARWLADPRTTMFFALPETSECFDCPEGGFCDGTTQVLLHADMYRPSADSYHFYSCELPISSESCRRPNGTCSPEYTGARCSACADGYGKTGYFCRKCPSQGTLVSYFVLLFVISIVFITLLVFTSFTTPLSSTLPVLIKIAINHLQIASRIPEIVTFPDSLNSLFHSQLQVSELVRFDIVAAECAPLNLSIYGKFYFVISLPGIMITFFAFVFFGMYIVRRVRGTLRNQNPTLRGVRGQQSDIRRDRIMILVGRFIARIRAAAFTHHGDLDRDELREQYYTSFQYFQASTIIITFLLYPSVLQWCAQMWKCETIVSGWGDGITTGNLREQSVLVADRNIDCNDSNHSLIKSIALIIAIAYGIGVPFVSFLIVFFHWQEHARAHTRRLFAYMVAGFDTTTWYWEVVVMMRKAAIVFILIFVTNDLLRIYFAMWAMTFALGAHSYFQPYDPRRPSLYYLESLGITTIVVTLNLSLLFQFSAFDDGTHLFNLLVVVLFGVNILTLGVFVLMIAQQCLLRIKQSFAAKDTRREGSTSEPQPRMGRRGTTIEDLRNEPQGDSFDMGNLEKTDSSFADIAKMEASTSRHTFQSGGLLGVLKKNSGIPELQQDTNQGGLDVGEHKVSTETQLERVQRLMAKRDQKLAYTRDVSLRADLADEVGELRTQLSNAQALLAAEDLVVGSAPELRRRRDEHEADLANLMVQIEQDRTQRDARNRAHAEYEQEIMDELDFNAEPDSEDEELQADHLDINF